MVCRGRCFRRIYHRDAVDGENEIQHLKGKNFQVPLPFPGVNIFEGDQTTREKEEWSLGPLACLSSSFLLWVFFSTVTFSSWCLGWESRRVARFYTILFLISFYNLSATNRALRIVVVNKQIRMFSLIHWQNCFQQVL